MSPDSETLLSELRRLNAAFPEGLVAVGDMAVLLHAINDGVEAAPASSIEAYLSLEHVSTVRDEVEVVRVPEAYKRRALLPNAQIDLYVERQHRLAVPYEDAHRYSTIVDGVRIACKEHLLILMIDAAIDPAAPADAEKHAQSIGTLASSLDDPRPDLLWPLLDTDRIALLREFGISTERIESLLRPELPKSEIDPERSDPVGDRAQAHNPTEATARAPREWTLKLQPNLDLLPARVSSEPFLEETTTIRELCTAAGMPYRYTGSTVPRVGLSKGLGNMRSVDAVNRRVLVVDVEQFHAETPHERSLRIIEVLAHSFHEYAARECVRGLFAFPRV